MHVQRGWDPEPPFASTPGRVAAEPMSVGRLLALTVAVAVAAVGLSVAAADLEMLPATAADGAAGAAAFVVD